MKEDRQNTEVRTGKIENQIKNAGVERSKFIFMLKKVIEVLGSLENHHDYMANVGSVIQMLENNLGVFSRPDF